MKIERTSAEGQINSEEKHLEWVKKAKNEKTKFTKETKKVMFGIVQIIYSI